MSAADSRSGPHTRAFAGTFDEKLAVGEAGNSAFFGLDVLDGFIEGIRDFMNGRQDRWHRYRSLGPAMLGSAMWIDDDRLLGKLEALSAACIVVTKQPRNASNLGNLQSLNDRTPGLPAAAFHDLAQLAPMTDGKPVVIGPNSSMGDWAVPTIRTLGFRRVDQRLAPIIHAKLGLLGHLWWHDEDGSGHVADVIGFEPQRLWISSANFTRASRLSLEFGYWTEDRALVGAVERFLVKVIAASESLNPEADTPTPELAPVEFDDEAMAEALYYSRDHLDEDEEE